jgi:hypothetical protein
MGTFHQRLLMRSKRGYSINNLNMKNACCFLLLTVLHSFHTFGAVSDKHKHGGMLKVYSTNNFQIEAHATFKYADLVNRAIDSIDKVHNPASSITIKMAMYNFNKDVYVGNKPAYKNCYGKVAGTDFCTDKAGSETIIASLLRASKEGIVVHLLFHKGEGIREYLIKNNKPDNFHLTQVQWGMGSVKLPSDLQMHNKFLLVNHSKGDLLTTVYVATANIDPQPLPGVSAI